jgi:hypothetical protein
MHTGAAPVRPARYLDAPIYHLDLVLTTVEQREAKIARYESVFPGLAAPGGGELNRRYFRPEQHATLPPARVPDPDRAAIEAVVGAGRRTDTRLPPEVRAAGSDEVLRRWSGRALPEEAYRATIVPVERDHRMEAAERRALHVEVTNDGCEEWPWATPAQEPNIRMAYRWRESDGTLLESEGDRSSLPCTVAPAERCIVPVTVTAPWVPGRYLLEFYLVHEGVRWFGSPARIDVDVRISAGR